VDGGESYIEKVMSNIPDRRRMHPGLKPRNDFCGGKRRMYFNFKKGTILLLALVAALAMVMPVTAVSADDGDVIFKQRLGGVNFDSFESATTVSDGVIVVGWAYLGSMGTGDWTGVAGKGNLDAVIVKYDFDGNLIWKKVFGGALGETFMGVTAVSDGFIAVGDAEGKSIGTGDWAGLTAKGLVDAVIVKFDFDGNVVWKANFGGSAYDYFLGVGTVLNGVVAVGYSTCESFGTGDWVGTEGKGNRDAIAVYYGDNGEVIGSTNFGGEGDDCFTSVTMIPDSIVLAGYSDSPVINTVGNELLYGHGGKDAILVRYEYDGDLTWAKNFGGQGDDVFNGVAMLSDGIVAVGQSEISNSGNWAGITGNGGSDAFIAKYDFSGNLKGKKYVGTAGDDAFSDVIVVSDYIFTVGFIYTEVDMVNVNLDAFIAKYENSNWNNINAGRWDNGGFGGVGSDIYRGVTSASGDIIAVGTSSIGSFGNRDWEGVTGRGETDGTIVKYSFGLFIPVKDITGVQNEKIFDVPLELQGIVVPFDATNKTIGWTVKDPGTTGATITNGVLNTEKTGTVLVTATVVNGTAPGVDFTKEFQITVISSPAHGTGSDNTFLYAGIVAGLVAVLAIGALVAFKFKKFP
jgi:hypothetical protein